MKRLIFRVMVILATVAALSAATCACAKNEFDIKAYGPGEVVSERYLQYYGSDAIFKKLSITDELFERMYGKSFSTDCTTAREDLRYLQILHKDAAGRSIVGELVVNKKIADDVLEIFKALYKAGYPIERVLLIDDYDADDERSMNADNSSAFNFRRATGQTRVSSHGLGMAVDINPLYNPYYKVKEDGSTVVKPAAASKYVDRTKEFNYKITKGDICVKLFKEHGFKWGGDWASCKDWQHFEKSE